MKGVSIFILVFLVLVFNSSGLSQTVTLKKVANTDAAKMMKKYNAFLRGHRKVDGAIINTKVLKKIADDHPDQEVSVVYARYLTKGMKGKTTILVVIFTKEDKTRMDEVFDLGFDGTSLCPDPPNCNVK
jgi:hypothetical protein